MKKQTLVSFLTPRVRGSFGRGISVLSLRWLGRGFDFMKKEDGSALLQFGARPVKFIFWLSKNKGEIPTFLFSRKWESKILLGRLRAGYTQKPLDFAKLYRREMCIENAHVKTNLAQEKRIIKAITCPIG